MITRNIKKTLLEALEDTPVVFLAGARQTGKSTLVNYLAENEINAHYVTLDDYNMLTAARSNPDGFIAGLPNPVIIDEVQRAPELFLAIKADVDKNRQPGRFLLTGSANVLIIPKVSESLAGRVEFITMWPMSQGELKANKESFIDSIFSNKIESFKKQPLTEDELWELIITGGYPEVIQRKSYRRKRAWFKSYITTILQKDIKDLANIEGLTNLPNILQLLAGRCASLINYTDISRSLQIPQTTLKRYITLLESTFLVHKLLPWSGNFNSRLTKSPKIFLNDTGLISYLLGIDKDRLTNDRTLAGQILENFIVNELLKQVSWSSIDPEVYHFRTLKGNEVDIILENQQGNLVAIEIKATSRIKPKDLKGIKYLKESIKEKFICGIILYTGNEIIPFDNNIHAVPISAIWM